MKQGKTPIISFPSSSITSLQTPIISFPSSSITSLQLSASFAHSYAHADGPCKRNISNGQEEQLSSLISSSLSSLLAHRQPTHFHPTRRCGQQCKKPPQFLSSCGTLKPIRFFLYAIKFNWFKRIPRST